MLLFEQFNPYPEILVTNLELFEDEKIRPTAPSTVETRYRIPTGQIND